MTKKILFILGGVALFALIISGSLMANYFIMAWTEPTVPPPGGTVSLESVPVNGVVAFYSAACPTGWKAADGTNSTPDLRGQFIRGINDFGSAAGARTDGNEDPDGLRVLGNLQQDEFEQHTHIQSRPGLVNGAWGTAERVNEQAGITGSTGGSETRPRNVALIYCVKE